ncbi:hypothetical protein ZOSMA_5G00830 [Zostera marina]|uniref:Uncharacterized protein n=1 Tax=Zostera marina TaxID=29655 RepID=A0A0K9NW88_ZOSMR|nr:hypothetical protein ZOSMA_5G00830 [Zostera marina]
MTIKQTGTSVPVKTGLMTGLGNLSDASSFFHYIIRCFFIEISTYNVFSP